MGRNLKTRLADHETYIKQSIICIRATNIKQNTRILKHTKHDGIIEDTCKGTDNELWGNSIYI